MSGSATDVCYYTFAGGVCAIYNCPDFIIVFNSIKHEMVINIYIKIVKHFVALFEQEIIVNRSIPIDKLVTHYFKIEDIQKGFEIASSYSKKIIRGIVY